MTELTRNMLDSLKGQLVVSVQAYPGEPMRDPRTMALIAAAAELGGAAAIRCQGLGDITAIKGQVSVPVIGLWKEGKDGVFITPTLRHARACSAAGADIVALDATRRPRPDGLTYAETIKALHDDGIVVMADCGSLEDARMAAEAGSDILSTTLSGYSGERKKTVGPDLDLLSQMVEEFDRPVLCEGRVHSPEQARAALDAGAWSVVVGTAITHPTTITSWFTEALHSSKEQ